MARNNDLDPSIEGFDNDDVIYRRPGHRRVQPMPEPQPEPVAETEPEAEAEPQPRPTKRKASGKKQSKDAKDDKPAWIERVLSLNTRVFLGVLLMFCCIFFIAAFASHYKNAPTYQAFVDNATQQELASGKVDNVAGGFGAWLAQVCMCDSLGLGSLVFIPYLWLLGLALIGVKKIKFWSLTFHTLLLAISISVVLGLVFYTAPSMLKWGGLHGYFINKFLMDHISVFGAILVSCLLVAAVCCAYLDQLRRLWLKWRQGVESRRARAAMEKERQERAKRLADIDDDAEEPNPQSQTPAGAPQADAGDSQPAPTDTPRQPATISLDEIFDIDTHETRQFVFNPDDAPAEIGAPAEPAEVAAYYPSETSAGFTISETPAESDDPGSDFVINTAQIEMAEGIETAEPAEEEERHPDQQSAYELMGPYDHRADLSHYEFPGLELLAERESGPVIDREEQQANKDRIVKTLADYKIAISRIEATVGPTVTLYEIVPAEGVRISQIKRLEDDIALSLAALGIRIIAPIPGKGTIGIEVPNSKPQTVSMRSVLASKKYQECKMALPMAMGSTISNDIFIADLAKMPHLLVAGATGMGKSVGLNAIIASLLYKKHPSELKFVLIDPKMVEFSLYSKLERHYMAKLPDEEDAIITDPSKVILTLNSLCVEMDNRYAMLRKANVRSLEEYNKKFTERRLSPENGHKYLPYIVVIVDEFADLIMTAGKEVETPIARIAQKARAVGMHMIIATQRPSTNVITGIIKANFPGRVAFRVSQMVDSKTILDRPGANQLIGRGDMLFSHNGSMDRVQCAFISTEEVEAITEHIDHQQGYPTAYELPEAMLGDSAVGEGAGASTERDPMFEDAARFVVQRQNGSTSSIQRQFNLGYNRAGRLMDQMEAAGIVGPVNGSKPRAILVDSMTLERILENR